MDFDAEVLRSSGWRQGALVMQPDVSKIGLVPALEEELGAADCLIVASHDCDLLHRDLAKEPFVEFVVARSREKAAGDLLYAKNPRKLVLESSAYRLEIDVHSKCRASRQDIGLIAPVGFITEQDLRILRRWLGNRYSRAAFPDEFNSRTVRIGDRVRRALKRAPELSGIYIATSDHELDSGVSYKVVVVGCMPAEAYANTDRRIACQEAIDIVTSLLDGCDGIEAEESELRSEADLSLDDLHYVKRWDYDSLTYRDDAGIATPEIEP